MRINIDDVMANCTTQARPRTEVTINDVPLESSHAENKRALIIDFFLKGKSPEDISLIIGSKWLASGIDDPAREAKHLEWIKGILRRAGLYSDAS